ncbi:MAG: hypothetical protein J6M17_04920 [Ruminococcus sp.]|nr:hypothetical protein [Ruminococcus sp.]
MKKNKMIAAITAAFALLLLGGCAGMNSEASGERLNSKKNIKAAVKKLGEQYNTDFTYVEDKPFKEGSGNVFGKHSGVSVHVYVKCDELPGEKITLISLDGDTVSSDYIFKLYEDEMTERIRALAKRSYDGEIGVFFEEDKTTSSFDSETTAEDVLASGELDSIKICTTDNEQHEEKYTAFSELLTENRINCLPFVYIYDENVYSSGETNIFDMTNKHGIGLSRNRESLSQRTLDDNFKISYEFYDYFISQKGNRIPDAEG